MTALVAVGFSSASVYLSLSVFLHDMFVYLKKTDAARIAKLDTEIFHDESRKPIYFGVKTSKVKITRHKNSDGVDHCSPGSAGFYKFTCFYKVYQQHQSSHRRQIMFLVSATLGFLANVLRYVRYMLSVVRLLSVCLLSVCLWRWCTLLRRLNFLGNFLSPYDSPGTLLFWCQKSLVEDAPFPLKYLRSKWPTPLSNSKIWTNIGS